MPRSGWTRIVGRLPYAERRDAAAGYVMATAAATATAVWYGGAIVVLLVAGLEPSTPDLETAVLGSVFVAPLGVPIAFAVGTLVWRAYAPPDPDPRRGALLGGLTALGSLVVSCLAAPLTVGLLILLQGSPPGPGQVPAFVLTVAVVALAVGLVFATWLVVPVGALAGWYHERRVADVARDTAERAV